MKTPIKAYINKDSFGLKLYIGIPRIKTIIEVIKKA